MAFDHLRLAQLLRRMPSQEEGELILDRAMDPYALPTPAGEDPYVTAAQEARAAAGGRFRGRHGVGTNPQTDPLPNLEDLALGTARGTPFVGSYTDEALAGARSLFGEDYETALGAERERARTFEERYPGWSTATGLAGTVGGVGALVKAAPKALGLIQNATRGANVAAGAAAGAGEGAVRGFGEGEGFEDRLQSAAINAGLGTALGGAGGGLFPGTGRAPLRAEFSATHETLPGYGTGHMRGLHDADEATRLRYQDDPRSWWNRNPTGEDEIYRAIPGQEMRPSVPMQGVWKEDGRPLELNRGMTARPMVTIETDEAGRRAMSPQDRRNMETGATVRGYIDAQLGSAGHAVFPPGRASDVNMADIPLTRALTPDEAKMLYEGAGPRAGLPDIADRGLGVTATNWMGDVDPARLAGQVRQGGGLASEVEAMLGVRPRAAQQEGIYQPLDLGAEKAGTRAATKQVLAELDSNPALRDVLDQNPDIPRNALARMERDAEFATSPTDARADIQRARAIIAEGPGWVERLRAAVARGEVLPAVAAAVLTGSAAELSGGRE